MADPTTPPVEDPELAALRDEAAALRASNTLGQSPLLLALFDFLLGASLSRRSPKETEIAQTVFTRAGDFNAGEDATVRVYVHRLRRKIDEHYTRRADQRGPRLAIPRGEYRLVLSEAPQEPAAVPELPPPPSGRMPRRWLLAGAAAVVVANAGAWYAYTRPTPVEATMATLRGSLIWAPVVASARPTSIVVGDYYIFGDRERDGTITRLIRDFNINSREDLDQTLMDNPGLIGRHIDVDLHYLPISIAPALQKILPLVNVPREDWRIPRTITTSLTGPDRIKFSNIVYVGLLSGLGTLKEPVFRASRFKIGMSYDELIDKKTGRRVVAEQPTDGRRVSAKVDFAYVASFPGPSANRVVIIAGARDAGVLQAADIASSPRMLADLARRVNNADAFEALYEVDSIDTTNVGAKLIAASPLDANAIWTHDRSERQAFPDSGTDGR